MRKTSRAAVSVFASVAFALLGCGSASTPPATTAAHGTESPPSVGTPKSALLALSKRDHTLAIVDPSTLRVVARLPVGEDPHEVIASEDGRTAYVSNYGGGAYNTLAVLDLVRQKAEPSIDLGGLRGPHGLAAIAGKIWFTAEAAKAIGRYNPTTSQVDWVLGTGQDRTHMLYVSSDAQRIVTANVGSGTMTVIEKAPPGPPMGGPPPPPPGGAPAGGGSSGHPGAPPGPHGPPGGDWHETVIAVGAGPEGFDVSPDGKEIWVANAHDGTVSIIELATKQVTQTVAAEVPGANRLKFTRDGRRVLISSLRGAALTVLDAASRTVIKRVPIGHGAAGILIEPDGGRAFVACTPDDSIAVIDVASSTVVGHIDVGPEPDGLAWAIER